MKAGELATKLRTYGIGLNRIGAIDAAVGVAELSGFLSKLRAKSITDVAVFLRAANKMGLATGKPSVAEVAIALSVLEELVPALEIRKQDDLVEALRQLRFALSSFEPFSVESYMKELSSRVASVSRRRGRGPEDVNEALVSDYLRRLEKALPDADCFASLFAELTADERVQQAEAVALASRFLSPTSASTSRTKALAKVLERHTTLMRSRAGRRAGKSAA
jgi:hypothetical protein